MKSHAPLLVKSILESKGFETRFLPDLCLASDEAYREFKILWASSRHRKTEYQLTKSSTQKMNHFQTTSILTRKDKLIRLLRKMKNVHGRVYGFVPTSFILPSEYGKFVKVYSEEELEREDDQPPATWICKPSDMSQGRKIFLIQNIMDLVYDQQYVVQRYISSPLTIGGYKVDFRVYVLVASFNPLVVYVHKNGLARFATKKYSQSNLGDAFAHLTNNSINKHSSSYTTAKDVIGSGCKWDFEQLEDWFRTNELDYSVVWRRIERLVALTLLAAVPHVPPHPSCFELFGFDVLLTDKLRPWLLEVNCAPALSVDCDVDERVKPGVVEEMFEVIERNVPVGGYERIFPFNEASKEASQNIAKCFKAKTLSAVSKEIGANVKKIVGEIKKNFMSGKR